jgi:hypothetical protein
MARNAFSSGRSGGLRCQVIYIVRIARSSQQSSTRIQRLLPVPNVGQKLYHKSGVFSLRTDYIKTALKVAETGHFNTASKELFMAEMTAFMRIRALEQELGFKLFDRPKYHLNPVVPTLQGAKWLTLARRALELLDQGTVEMAVSTKAKGRKKL